MDEKEYKFIIENSNFGYSYHRIICDEKGVPCDYEFLEVNSAFERHTGLKGKDVIGRRYTEVLEASDLGNDEWIKLCGEIALYGGSREIERYSTDFARWFRTSLFSPQKGYFVTWTIDISKEMREIDEKNILLTATNDIIFELDENRVFQNVIADEGVMLFMPKADFMGKRLDDLFQGELGDIFISAFNRASLSRKKEFIRYKSPVPGEDKWFEAAINLWNNDSSRTKYIVGIREITEQKRMELELANKTEEFERFFSINLDLLCIADLQGNFLKVNNAWERILGYPASELEKRNFLEFVHPDDIEATLDSMSKLGNNEQILNFVNRYVCMDGSYRYIEWCSQPYNGLIYGAARDITDRKLVEEALRISEERLEIAMKAAKAGFWDWDMKNDSIYYSPTWKAMLGYDQDEVEDTFEAWQELWHPDERERNLQMMDDYISGRVSSYEIPHRLRTKTGEWQWILTRGELIRDSNKEPSRWIGTNIDITHIKEAEREIRYLSFHDQLTGLYNRRFYEEELHRLDTIRNLPLSIIMADVNGLKLANDAFGHMFGDKLLKKTAEIFRRECRADEIVSRIGGDEFVIILPGTDHFGAEMLVKRIREAIANVQVDMLELSISLGWATKKHPREAVEDIFNKAEDAMYKHKLIESSLVKERAVKYILEGLFNRYPEERAHSQRVRMLCEEAGKRMGMSGEDIEVLKAAALMHDIGQITLEGDILSKPGRLDEAEWAEIKRHPEKGYLILNSVNSMAQQAKYVLHHHERWDGKGYPNGLKGENIPKPTTNNAKPETKEEMTSKRPYKAAMNREEAIKEIEAEAGTQFDPAIAAVFREIIKVQQ